MPGLTFSFSLAASKENPPISVLPEISPASSFGFHAVVSKKLAESMASDSRQISSLFHSHLDSLKSLLSVLGATDTFFGVKATSSNLCTLYSFYSF